MERTPHEHGLDGPVDVAVESPGWLVFVAAALLFLALLTAAVVWANQPPDPVSWAPPVEMPATAP